MKFLISVFCVLVLVFCATFAPHVWMAAGEKPALETINTETIRDKHLEERLERVRYKH